jgi:transposase
MLAKARRAQFGQSSERGQQLIEQLELAIEDLEETQAVAEAKSETAAPEAAKKRRARAPRGPRKLPDNLPVERIIEPAPCACGKCGGLRLRRLGEVVTKTLECEPRRWKIIEHVREKFSCRDCEAITEPPAPSHPIPRGFAGPSLLAMVLVSKFLMHQPLNRQSAAYAREGVEIDTSTLADRVGACVVALDPIVQAIRAHVLRAERIHADDTTVPVLAKLKTVTGRLWTYVRDDQLLVAGFSNRGDVSASSCNSEPFTAAARPRLKSHFLGGRNGGKSAAARDSDAIELRAVPAICLAPSYRWAPGPSTETDLACDLQLHFTIALPGVPVEGAADRKRSRRPSRNSLLAHL